MRLFLTAILTLVLASCASTPVKGEVVGKKHYPASRSLSSIKPIMFRNDPEKWTLNIKVEPGDIEEVTVSKEIFNQADLGEQYDDTTKQLSP